MIDTRAELGHWIGRLEMILISRGVLREDGELAIQVGSQFPKDLEDALDGFIENPIELLGLLKICRDARDGRPLSPAVLMAAHLMAREVLQALDSQAAGDFRA
ncbi:hypothetical protein ACCS70_20085 [Rhizobium ruizarguesonis]|jgi:hypothetical protein|uniref:hypothetical protein n=1 Tax=Rhizobium TaxID=379 RepID=UPI00103278D2|nr:hypothetical protein [Rhizobium ruizarguesonis]NEH34921.1 hypothetical protein [Rhizobium ruizarguesonis]NEI78745.1 hypothetical protein [Rhizobium ruizarguesonis]TAW77255.1 hypothetical protein ELI10_08580 [Rhizobium ruizarguesonis]TAX14220.1 hypothetical protein ELI09_08640 [Rhizobium ruizarguesonis]TAX19052.1 hypothetical protein ELI08_08640 [Rhizobium ruizarguesonis]